MSSAMTFRVIRLGRIFLAVALVCTLLLFLYFPNRLDVPINSVATIPSPRHSPPNSSSLPLPPDYASLATDPEWCESKYSTTYLTTLRDGRRSYCDPRASQSSLSCFGTKITDGREDVFCLANKASTLHTHGSTAFKLDCTTWKDSEQDNLRSVLSLQSFPKYMYNTGLYYIYNSYFSTTTVQDSEPFCQDSSESPKYTILLKREGSGNLWHSMMEIFSLYLTIDVLRISRRDPSEMNSEPFLSSADISSTQIVVLDDHPDGPYFDLWKLFAPLPIVRLNDLPSSRTPRCMENVIIPLAGGSNPLWRGDWHSGACTHSRLLDTFSERILSQYGLGRVSTSRSKDAKAELRLTFIDRKSSRVLLNTARHLDNLRAHFPNVHIQAIDFAAILFDEQLGVIQETDVLVGVHGAGMAHSMFLPDESSVVEILPHNLDYRVFRNLAKLRGHRYFSAHAELVGSGEWGSLDVDMDEDSFIELVEAGIRAVLHRGTRDDDVV